MKRIFYFLMLFLLSSISFGQTSFTNSKLTIDGTSGNAIFSADLQSSTINVPNYLQFSIVNASTRLGYNCGSLNNVSSTYLGHGAGIKSTASDQSVLIGAGCGGEVTTGSNLLLAGYLAGRGITTEVNSTCLGWYAGYSGGYNTNVGNQSGKNSTGVYNDTYGYLAGRDITSGTNNLCLGALAGAFSTTSSNNLFAGYRAGVTMTGSSAYGNVFLGVDVMFSATSGINNFVGGFNAGYGLTSASGCVLIGYNVANITTTLTDKLYIDNSNTSSPLIYGEFDNNKVQINGSLKTSDGLTSNILETMTNNVNDTLFSVSMLRIHL